MHFAFHHSPATCFVPLGLLRCHDLISLAGVDGHLPHSIPTIFCVFWFPCPTCQQLDCQAARRSITRIFDEVGFKFECLIVHIIL